MNFFKGLFSSARSKSKTKTIDVTTYQGYSIQPMPKEISNGWSTQAIITKQIDGQEKTHHFIRADAASSEGEAISLILMKAKTTIDQQGERIFT